MLEARHGRGPIEVLPFPVSNPRQELDTKQICESKDRSTLALRVSVDGVRLHVGLVLLQKVENGMTFPRAARRPAAHQCDIVIGHQVVANTVVSTIANVILRHEVLRVQIPFHPIGGCRLAGAPKLLQWELHIGIHNRCDCFIQEALSDVTLIYKSNLEAVNPTYRTRRLHRPQVAAKTEYR